MRRAPICTPTRCAFHTGRYPQRLEGGLREPLTQQNGADIGLPPSHPTVASLVRKAGYDTALIGKWHLGWKPEFGPNQHGFDEFFGILSGAADYFTHKASDAPGEHGPDGGPDLWEGGIRVPAIVRWPGVVPAARRIDQAAITMDWTATILSAAGAPADPGYPLDGEDLLPVCRGARSPYDRTLFWRVQGRDAARSGKWKYLKDANGERLYDLAVDPGEKVDLRRKNTEVFGQVKGQYDAWNARMLPRIET